MELLPANAGAQPVKTVEHEITTGAHALAGALARCGVDTVFACGGEKLRPLVEALSRVGIRVIATQHEQGAAHAADGYARTSGRCGVCVVGGGPGITGSVTGLATAGMDSVPVLCICAGSRREHLGDDSFQSIDALGIVRPCVKWGCLAIQPRAIARNVAEAVLVASGGRPGPVVMDIPSDVLEAPCPGETDARPRAHIVQRYAPAPPAVDEKDLRRATDLINSAQQPLLYVGRGAVIAGAGDVLRELAERASIPVAMTLLGLGVFDEQHRLSLGMLGMHGGAAANFAVQECDCLVAVGARFDDRVTGDPSRFAPGASIIHIDIDPSVVGRIVRPTVALVGDAKHILGLLLERVARRNRHDWLMRIANWKWRHGFVYFDDSDLPKPQYVIEEIRRQTHGNAVIVTGVGQHQMWTAQFFRFRRPRQFVTSGGLGTMGFGLPAGVGATAADPSCPVITIDGDGSFLMTSFELHTLARHDLPLKVAIISNGYLGMVKQWQDLFYQRRYSHSILKNPDFAALAEACGVRGMCCRRKEDVARTVREMLAHDGPVVAEFRVEGSEHVYPIVGPGRSLHEMHLGTLRHLDF